MRCCPPCPRSAKALPWADANTTQLIVTMFIFGMVFGELLFGPLCDAIGRKAAILLGLTLFCVGAGHCHDGTNDGADVDRAHHPGDRRFRPQDRLPRIDPRPVSPGESMAPDHVADLYRSHPDPDGGRPRLGSFLLTVANWQAIFGLYLVAALIGGLWLTLRQPETLPPERRIPIAPRRLFRNAARIMRHSHVLAYTGAAGLTFGAQLLFLSTAQSMFADIYGRAASFPFYFAVIALAVGIAAFTNRPAVGWVGAWRGWVALALYGLGASKRAVAVGRTHDGRRAALRPVHGPSVCDVLLRRHPVQQPQRAGNGVAGRNRGARCCADRLCF